MPPSQIARDTDVIHQVQPALGEPLLVYRSSILGAESMIVDTGTPADRERGSTTARVRLADHPGPVRPTTGVDWAVDTFATPLPDPNMSVAEGRGRRPAR